jgi:uncharacterized membrane protein YeaQ/YmgE (transglycosylase-associated protein family)
MAYAKDYLQKKYASGSSSSVVSQLTEGTFVGTAIGATLGLFIAYKNQKSYLMYAFIGAIGGAIVTRVFIAPTSTPSTINN